MSIHFDPLDPAGAHRGALPQPLPEPPPIADPVDTPYCGPLRLHVDASDVTRRIFRVTETIPVAGAGPLILLYPKWLPGFHAPQAPIELMAGLEIRAAGERLRWIRHPVTVNAFQIDVPEGVDAVEARFQFLAPTDPSQGRVLATADMLMLPWNTVLLYPGGHFARRIMVEASLTLPDGWNFATALERTPGEGEGIRFKPVALDILVDSPVLAAAHLRCIDLDDAGAVRLNVAADRPELLAINDAQLAPHRAVVEQCDRLFGARHFRHYDVLLALSDEMTSAGIEHHQSCEAVTIASYFTAGESAFPRRDTFPHEYVHSWNGKHRRGADSWSPCFEKPIRNSLMWVYEGQTQYWSWILAARSGLWTQEQTLGALAQTAAIYDVRPGSRWRPVIDTTRDPIIAARAPLPWKSWQRSEDYYSEGALVWLDVDTRLRELTGETRSLDDFARLFFGPDDGVQVTHTYRFEDVVETLASLADHDWKKLFEDSLTETHDRAPLDGIGRGGYRLVYRDTPNAYTEGSEALSGTYDFSPSIGLAVSADGTIGDVLWEGPAFDQGLTAGTTIVAVNDRAFTIDILKDAVAATADGQTLRLVAKTGQRVRDVRFGYSGGARYPHLERIGDAPARLDAILAAL